MMPWLKTIIISGYGDFESAQKAISLGVDQYLLKPIRSAELTKVIEDMARQIDEGKTKSALPGATIRTRCSTPCASTSCSSCSMAG